jgi:ATP-dependent DNA helicase RecG
MTDVELKELLNYVQRLKTETPTLEIKCAKKGTPEKLYDTLSSFSNQDDGGIILFGVDEKDNFTETGVYDARDLQRHVSEQCEQMEPKVRPLFTVLEKDGLTFVSAEIPGIDIADRPCYYAGKGRLKGSYIRVGDSDEPMTEYEIYSYEAFRRKYQDDIRLIDKAKMKDLDELLLKEYLIQLKLDRPNLSRLADERILELMNVVKNDVPTLSAVMLFGSYPQAYFPQLCITAIVVPGDKVGAIGETGERFIDNKRIEGTIPQMLDGAMAFIRKNIRVKTIIDESGNRVDKSEYPLTAIREAILNALIHRDYSIHTEGKPIQIIMFNDRLEICNPGGLYGRLSIDQLGKVQPDTRNPVIAVAMEIMKKTENRYSGIPTIYREFESAGLPKPEFEDKRGAFIVRFRNNTPKDMNIGVQTSGKDLVEFCKTARSRQEIAAFLGLKTIPFVMKFYINPLIEQNVIEMLYPDKPRSRNQLYRTKATIE